MKQKHANKNNRKRAKALVVLLTAAILCIAVPHETYAQEMNGERIIPPVVINIPVTHIVKGAFLEKEEYLFTLTAEDPKNPMPIGSENGSITIKVRGKEKVDFGALTFDYPDACYYRIARADGRDDSEYRVMVAAFSDGSNEVVAWKDGDEGKAEEIVFEDSYGTPGGSPKTGDDLNIKELAAISMAGILSLIAAVVLIVKRRREEAYDR